MAKQQKPREKTRIVVQMDPSLSAPIYLRGEGIPEINWQKGVELKREKPDEWVFETDALFSGGAFKVLINDQTYELGDSHPLYPGASMRINPRFPKD